MRFFATLVGALLLESFAAAAPQADLLPKIKENPIKYYRMLSQLSGPCDLSTGPDGNIWVSHQQKPIVTRIDPFKNTITEFPVPYKTGPFRIPIPEPFRNITNRATLGCVSQPGNDGKMYFAAGLRNEFAVLNLKTMKFKIVTFKNPLGNLQPFNDMWRGPPGTGMFITQTTANKVVLYDYKKERITKSWKFPTFQSGPVGTYFASDGLVWFCEFVGQKMASLNHTSGEFKEYPTGPVGPAVTRAETRDKDGNNFVWATGLLGGTMVKVNIRSGEVTNVPLSPPLVSVPVENTVDSLGNVWYSTATANTVNKLNPVNNKVTAYVQDGTPLPPLPLPVPSVNIAAHYGPGNDIWFTELARNRVGRLKIFGQKGRDTCCGPANNDRFKHLKGFDYYRGEKP